MQTKPLLLGSCFDELPDFIRKAHRTRRGSAHLLQFLGTTLADLDGDAFLGDASCVGVLPYASLGEVHLGDLLERSLGRLSMTRLLLTRLLHNASVQVGWPAVR